MLPKSLQMLHNEVIGMGLIVYMRNYKQTKTVKTDIRMIRTAFECLKTLSLSLRSLLHLFPLLCILFSSPKLYILIWGLTWHENF